MHFKFIRLSFKYGLIIPALQGQKLNLLLFRHTKAEEDEEDVTQEATVGECLHIRLEKVLTKYGSDGSDEVNGLKTFLCCCYLTQCSSNCRLQNTHPVGE